MKVIGKEKRLCPCCMEEHEVNKVHIEEQMSFKDMPVIYTAEYFYCDSADEFYMDEEMISSNDIRMKDAYRESNGLLTSKEIGAVREKYSISQKDLCTLLGWGGKTITRYEGHQVQDRAHDTILRKLDQDPEWFMDLLLESQGGISAEAYKRYFKIASLLYEENQDIYLRKAIEAKYACLHENEMYNGKTELSLDKVVDVICYFANSADVTNLYKVKLMKLLWYADTLAYKQRGCAITGLVYQAMPMGAVPIAHESLIALKGVECEEIAMGEGTAYRFQPSPNNQYLNLNDEEKRILDRVIERMGKRTREEIVNFMHQEKAYTETPARGIISFLYAKDLLI